MAVPAPPDWSPPPSFDGFEIVRPLGHGGMGTVFLARDVRLDRPVAIKIASLGEQQTRTTDRFSIEVQALARIRNPNVVAIYSAGKVDGRPYLAQELLLGQRLDQVRRPTPWTRVLAWGRGLARAVAAVHAGGVIHRDIKPGNVMLVDDRRVKLFDFGLAWLVHDAGDGAPRLTSPDSVVGTPAYVAPELWFGGDPDVLSDVYSLGLSLYELLVGELPHARLDRVALKEEVFRRELPSVRSQRPDVPHALAALIDRCVTRDPGSRVRSAAALRTALDGLAVEHRPSRGAWQLDLEATDHDDAPERADLDGLVTEAMPVGPPPRSLR